MDPLTIGAIVGGILGAVVITVFVVCIVYVTKRLRKRTNARAKLITAQGRVLESKWVKDSKEQKRPDDDKTYFGNVQETDHVMVKEKRHTDIGVAPPRRAVIPPVLPPLPPEPSPPPLRGRKFYRSFNKDRTPPAFRRRPSFGAEKPRPYLMYMLPYQQNSNQTYGTSIPRVSQGCAATVTEVPPRETKLVTHVQQTRKANAAVSRGTEEQEHVMTLDDAFTEYSFKPKWSQLEASGGGGATAVVQSGTAGYDFGFASQLKNHSDITATATTTNKEVPVIVTDVI